MKLSFKDYMEGKELFKETLPLNEKEQITDINEKYKQYLKENNYSIDNLILEKTGIIKRFIGRRIIRNVANKYANAYRDWKFVDVEERKERTSPKWDDLEPKEKNRIKEKFNIKKDAAKDKLDAVSERMDTIAKNYGVTEFAANARTKARLEAVEEVMKEAKKVFTESQKEALEQEHENLKEREKEAERKRKEAREEDEKIENEVEAAKKEGFKKIKDDEDVDEEKWTIATFKDDDGNEVKMKKEIEE